MSTVDYAFVLLILVGHVALWVGVFNWLHAAALPCWLVNLLEKTVLLCTAALPAALLLRLSLSIWPLDSDIDAGIEASLGIVNHFGPWIAYAFACAAVAMWTIPIWLVRRLTEKHSPALLSSETTVVDLEQELGHRPIDGFSTRLLARFPGNQILQLHIHEKTLLVPRLDKELEGLTIAHLSDLHFTGKLTRDFFDSLIEKTNRFDADLVAVTGDIIDFARCLDWIPQTLGKLTSRYGVYFVLGNHDHRAGDPAKLRKILTDAGLVDVGFQRSVIDIQGRKIAIVGNELPWFRPKLLAADFADAKDESLRILLSHSPDQIAWAKKHRFDLMLAGHTHGGQIRFPLLGPTVCPSRYGVKYAAGVYYEAPTLMHVTRGVSGLQPIRLRCPPELTKLILKCGANRQASVSRTDL